MSARLPMSPVPVEAVGKTPHVVILSAALVGACQYIPVPFVDDYIEGKVLKIMVQRLLKQNGMSLPVEDVKLLYQDRSGLSSRGRSLLKKVVLKPVKTLFRPVFLLFSTRRTAKLIAETILLGRAIDHLARQDLPKQSTLERFRPAFREAVTEADVSLSEHFESLVKAQKERFQRLARQIRHLLDRGEEPTVRPSRELEEEGAQVKAALEHPAVQDQLLYFDDVFAEKLGAVGVLQDRQAAA